MNNIIVATRSPFREYLFKGNLKKSDVVIYESKKDFVVNYETKYLDNFISNFIKNNFNCKTSKCDYFQVDNINSPNFLDLIKKNKTSIRLIMTGANFLRKKQYIEVSKIIKTRLNIHFGDPNKYRGLDSNIWSMLEDKKSYPVVTLHHANLNLDSGDIIFQAKSNKKFEEMTLKEFIKFEIEGAKICLSKALEINENTPIDSKFKNRGIYKTAMNSIEKKQAFQNLIPS